MASGKTIRDVAREAGVSIATVSYVLNNSRNVGPETRARVLEAAGRLAYRPNITARNLQASETRLFAYTWQPSPPDHFNPILDSFLQAAVYAAAERGYRFLVFPTANSRRKSSASMKRLCWKARSTALCSRTPTSTIGA